MQTSPPLIRFGLNYVPSKRWVYCWNDWQSEEIAEDFDAIAALGVDHLRVMVIWPWFQPNPASVSEAHLRRLDELMDLAEQRGLDVFLCPLTGWLSGYRFLPPDVSAKDIFCNPAVFDQIGNYFQALLRIAGARRNFLGFDLGNEMNVLVPDLPTTEGDAWGKRITEWLHPQMSGKWIVNGVDHNPWFAGNTFTAAHLVETYDAATVHAWPLFTGSLLKGGLADPPSLHLSAFLTHLCRHLLKSANLNKPIWIQEFGCSSEWGAEREKAAYLRGSVEYATKAGATWFTWWCSHDIDKRYRFDPLEYDLGLFTTENQPKPLAHLYRELIQEFANFTLSPEPIWDFGDNFFPAITHQLPPEKWVEQNLETHTGKLFERYLTERAR